MWLFPKQSWNPMLLIKINQKNKTSIDIVYESAKTKVYMHIMDQPCCWVKESLFPFLNFPPEIIEMKQNMYSLIYLSNKSLTRPRLISSTISTSMIFPTINISILRHCFSYSKQDKKYTHEHCIDVHWQLIGSWHWGRLFFAIATCVLSHTIEAHTESFKMLFQWTKLWLFKLFKFCNEKLASSLCTYRSPLLVYLSSYRSIVYLNPLVIVKLFGGNW